jgi:hypothetical protein
MKYLLMAIDTILWTALILMAVFGPAWAVKALLVVVSIGVMLCLYRSTVTQIEFRTHQLKYNIDRLNNFIRFVGPTNEKSTCEDCADKNICPLAFDPYNKNGDCLQSK